MRASKSRRAGIETRKGQDVGRGGGSVRRRRIYASLRDCVRRSASVTNATPMGVKRLSVMQSIVPADSTKAT